MKRVIFLAMFLAFAGVGVFAQAGSSEVKFGAKGPDPGTDMKAMDETKLLDTVAHLTTEQLSKAVVINKNFYYQLRNTDAGNVKAAEKIAEEHDKELMALLTPEQWKLWRTYKETGKKQ